MADEGMPDWLIRRDDDALEADPDRFYPVFMEELEYTELDQFTREMCFLFMKLDAQRVAHKLGLGPAETGRQITLHVASSAARKDRYKAANLPEGKGEAAAYEIVPPFGSTYARQLYISKREGHPYIHLNQGQAWGVSPD